MLFSFIMQNDELKPKNFLDKRETKHPIYDFESSSMICFAIVF
jgi:hypothetical protein